MFVVALRCFKDVVSQGVPLSFVFQNDVDDDADDDAQNHIKEKKILYSYEIMLNLSLMFYLPVNSNLQKSKIKRNFSLIHSKNKVTVTF